MKNEGNYASTFPTILIAILFSFLIFSGCATNGINIRASNKMLENNPIQKIAVFAEGKVNWPSQNYNLTKNTGSSIILSTSKEALTNSLFITEKVLINKGYDIVASEPVGIGYNSNGWWLVDDSGEKADKHLLDDSNPVFLYSGMKEGTETTEAARHLVEEFERADFLSFIPTQEYVEVIRKHTGADTIGLVRVYGEKYSTGRKVGDFAWGVLAASVGATRPSYTQDKVALHYVFIDANTNDVAWAYGSTQLGNPLNPDPTFIDNILHYFPEKGHPLNKETCKITDNGLLQCKFVPKKVVDNEKGEALE